MYRWSKRSPLSQWRKANPGFGLDIFDACWRVRLGCDFIKHLHKSFPERDRKSFPRDGYAVVTCLFLRTLCECGSIILMPQTWGIKGINPIRCIVSICDYDYTSKEHTFIFPVRLPGMEHTQTGWRKRLDFPHCLPGLYLSMHRGWSLGRLPPHSPFCSCKTCGLYTGGCMVRNQVELSHACVSPSVDGELNFVRCWLPSNICTNYSKIFLIGFTLSSGKYHLEMTPSSS